MFDLKSLAATLSALALFLSAAEANTGECPEMSGVLDVVQPEGTGAKINKNKLLEEVGKTAGNTGATADLANHLKSDLPGNSEAVIADLMIAAYCEFLASGEGDIALDTSVQNYQKTLYDEVFSNPEGVVTSDDARPDGWLFGAD